MNWHHGRLALFDTETTGVDPREDRIVTAAILLVGGGQPTIRRSWMLRCTRPIPDGAAAIHGITTEHANTHGIDHAVGVGAIAEELVQASSLGIPIVGHNVAYDVTILRAELQRHGHTRLAEQVSSIEPVIDTYVCDKWVDPYRKGSRRLVDISNHYGVPLDESDAHGAEADALAAGRVAWVMANRWPGLQMPLRELHREQVGWKREQAESFGRYLVKHERVDDVSRCWPILERVEVAEAVAVAS